MTTDPVHHAISAASDALRHLLRAAAAAHLRSARTLAGDNAWTVQELHAAWRTERARIDARAITLNPRD